MVAVVAEPWQLLQDVVAVELELSQEAFVVTQSAELVSFARPGICKNKRYKKHPLENYQYTGSNIRRLGQN